MRKHGWQASHVLPQIGGSCRDCIDRRLGCHATCPKYAEDLQRRERFRQEIRKETEIGAVAAEAEKRWNNRRTR